MCVSHPSQIDDKIGREIVIEEQHHTCNSQMLVLAIRAGRSEMNSRTMAKHDNIRSKDILL
jgi:hypothetical protein